MTGKKFSRREFLRMSALTAVGAAFAGCCPVEAPPAQPAATQEPVIVTSETEKIVTVIPTMEEAEEPVALRIGVIYDFSGPFAAGGSVAAATGTAIAIEMVNEEGGILGEYPVEAITADAQSDADVALNEAERLLTVENVDALVGIYSSAHAMPIAGKVDQMKEFVWFGVPSSTAVLKDRGLQYAFRCLPHSDQFGELAPKLLSEVSEEKMGIAPSDLTVAIIHEDGPYGSGVGAGNEAAVEKYGLQLVLKEGYAATTPDLSALVTKLRGAAPDVILHTGYNPDITLFLRQAREQGLRFKALFGHGAGYSQIDKLSGAFGSDVDYILNIDPPAAQLLDPNMLAPGIGDLTQEYLRRYIAKTGITDPPPQASGGFNHTWIFLTEVVPNALENYGDWSPDSLRQAALDLDIPDGGTVSGYGIKFYPPDDPMSGQNMRAFPVIMQYLESKPVIVYPPQISSVEPTLPLPEGHPYAAG